jgi:hypothetical protein
LTCELPGRRGNFEPQPYSLYGYNKNHWRPLAISEQNDIVLHIQSVGLQLWRNAHWLGLMIPRNGRVARNGEPLGRHDPL